MSTTVQESTLVGGRYRLQSLLGQGGMGRVWAAHDEVLDRGVAVKEVLVPPAVPEAEREALVARTMREGRAAARVRHPRVVTVYDVVEDDDRPWLVLQLLQPRTLADVLAEEGPLAPARAALIGLQVLDGLAAVHAAGVLHRDVKPANVLFGRDGGAVLADFGVATLESEAAVTSTGLVLGSPAYLAPERARGQAPTPAADLWSLGATLFAAVEGRSPFHREGPLPTLGALLTEDVPDAPSAGPLAPAIAALLTKDPAARPGADAVRPLLAAALTPPPAPAAERTVSLAAPVAAQTTAAMALRVVPPAVPSAVPVPRRPRRALVALAAVALLSAPLAALGQRHSALLTDAPAAAGTALSSTTPKNAAAMPAATKPSTTALRKTGSTAPAKGAATRLAATALSRNASTTTGVDHTTQLRASANPSESGRDGSDEKGDDGKTKSKDKHDKGDNGDANGGGDD